MALSPRLRAIADMITPGSRVADVGTDHGYLPVFLLENGISPLVYASDIRPGPLRSAMDHAAKAGLRDKIRFSLSDGLSDCPPELVDTVVIAGMGGETMISILSAAPWTVEKKLILQPQTKNKLLRRWLHENGYAVRDAALSCDAGRLYVIWLCTGGEESPLWEVDYYVEPCLAEKRDPLLPAYADGQLKTLFNKIQGLERAAAADTGELALCLEAVKGLRKIKEEIQ